MPGNTFYETIFKGVIFGSFFGIAYFLVEGQQKLANDQQKLIGEVLSQYDGLQKLANDQQKLLGEALSQLKK